MGSDRFKNKDLVLRCAVNDYSPIQRWPGQRRELFDLESIIDLDISSDTNARQISLKARKVLGIKL